MTHLVVFYLNQWTLLTPLVKKFIIFSVAQSVLKLGKLCLKWNTQNPGLFSVAQSVLKVGELWSEIHKILVILTLMIDNHNTALSLKQMKTWPLLMCDRDGSEALRVHKEVIIPCSIVDGAGQRIARTTWQTPNRFLNCRSPVHPLHQSIEHLHAGSLFQINSQNIPSLNWTKSQPKQAKKQKRQQTHTH